MIRRRITPAGAGKTTYPKGDRGIDQDHPRRCGENTAIAASMPINIGSPPQVRGKLVRVCINVGLLGITPAGAGKTY